MSDGHDLRDREMENEAMERERIANERETPSTPPGDWEVVEEALDVREEVGMMEARAALARLREIAALEAQAHKEWCERALKAEAGMSRLREREAQLTKERDILFKGDWAALNLRAEAAEAEVERLRAELKARDE